MMCLHCGDPVPDSRKKYCCDTCMKKFVRGAWQKLNRLQFNAYHRRWRRERVTA